MNHAERATLGPLDIQDWAKVGGDRPYAGRYFHHPVLGFGHVALRAGSTKIEVCFDDLSDESQVYYPKNIGYAAMWGSGHSLYDPYVADRVIAEAIQQNNL